MAVLQKPKSKVNMDYDDEEDEDIEYDEEDDVEDLPVKPKAMPQKKPSRPTQPIEEEEEPKRKSNELIQETPQYVQIPKVVSEADMLNIIYEQQLQILNLLQKKDE